MPTWLTIILALGGSSVIGLVVTDIYRLIKSKSKKHLEASKREKQEEVREVFKEELKGVKEDLALVKDGLQKDLYIDLKTQYEQIKKKEFATLNEKRDYDSLYQSYHNLGKNGVADSMHETIMHMPEFKEISIHKSKKVKVSEKSEEE